MSQKCPYCGKDFKRLSAHKCPEAPAEKKIDKISPETPKLSEETAQKPAEKPIRGPSLKELINKTQAETNIGLVGHVDHGKKIVI